jgi:hypothetical protein
MGSCSPRRTDHLSNVEAVAEQVSEEAYSKPDRAANSASTDLLTLGANAAAVKKTPSFTESIQF